MEDVESAVLKHFKECLKKVTDVRQQWKISYKIWILFVM